jgi:hypothetical protein
MLQNTERLTALALLAETVVMVIIAKVILSRNIQQTKLMTKVIDARQADTVNYQI